MRFKPVGGLADAQLGKALLHRGAGNLALGFPAIDGAARPWIGRAALATELFCGKPVLIPPLADFLTGKMHGALVSQKDTLGKRIAACAPAKQPPNPGAMLHTTTFAPLRHRVFAMLVFGSLLANLGNTIQSVGASWHLTQQGWPADVVALVQTAYNLPIMLLGLPAGAWSDMVDKRRMLLAALFGMLAVSILLAVLVQLEQLVVNTMILVLVVAVQVVIAM